MLLFSTILEINDRMTKDAFINLVIEWNQGSPHKENIIADIKWNGERNISLKQRNRGKPPKKCIANKPSEN